MVILRDFYNIQNYLIAIPAVQKKSSADTQ
jgi:hypothetical protein